MNSRLGRAIQVLDLERVAIATPSHRGRQTVLATVRSSGPPGR